MKKALIASLLAFAALWGIAYAQTSPIFWIQTGTKQLRPTNKANGLLIQGNTTTLSFFAGTNGCLSVDASGNITTSTCSGGAGSGSFNATGTAGQAVIFSGANSGVGYPSLTFSTSSLVIGGSGTSTITGDGTNSQIPQLNSTFYVPTNFAQGGCAASSTATTLQACFNAWWQSQINVASGTHFVVQASVTSSWTGTILASSSVFTSLDFECVNGAQLTYTGSGTAFQANNGNPTGHIVNQVHGCTFMGSSTLLAAGAVNGATTTGLVFGGANGAVGYDVHDNSINGFGSCVDTATNTYMFSFHNNAVSGCGSSANQPWPGSLFTANKASNSGERFDITHNTFTDPTNSTATNAIFLSDNGNNSTFLCYNSLDDVGTYVGISQAMVNYCYNHVENSAPLIYPGYYFIVASSSGATTLNVEGNLFANDANAAFGNSKGIEEAVNFSFNHNEVNKYGNQTITNFINHDINAGQAVEEACNNWSQNGAVSNWMQLTGTAYPGCFYESGNGYPIIWTTAGNSISTLTNGQQTVISADQGGNISFPVSTSLVTVGGKLNVTSTATFQSTTTLARFAAATGCLSVDSAGNITTSTCSGAGGDVVQLTSSSPWTANVIPLILNGNQLTNSMISATSTGLYIATGTGWWPFDSTSTAILTLGSSSIINGSVSGTFLGSNASTGFAGDFINFQVNSSSKYRVSATGTITASGNLVLTSSGFVKDGANILIGGNGTNLIMRPDSSGGQIQIQSFAGTTNSFFADGGAANLGGTLNVTSTSAFQGLATLNGSGVVSTGNLNFTNGAVLQIAGTNCTNGGAQWICNINQTAASGLILQSGANSTISQNATSTTVVGNFVQSGGVNTYTASTSITGAQFLSGGYILMVSTSTTQTSTFTLPGLTDIAGAAATLGTSIWTSSFAQQFLANATSSGANLTQAVSGTGESIYYAPGTPTALAPGQVWDVIGQFTNSSTVLGATSTATRLQLYVSLYTSSTLSNVIPYANSLGGYNALTIGGGLQLVNGVLSSTISGGGGGGGTGLTSSTLWTNNGLTFVNNDQSIQSWAEGQISTTTRQLTITASSSVKYGISQSTGGVVNITGSNTTSTALVIYSNRGSDQAGNLVRIMCDGPWAINTDCVNFQSAAATATVLQVVGSSTNKGVFKSTINGAGYIGGVGVDQSNAAAFSALINSTSAQGYFEDTSASGTTGNLATFRNGGADIFDVTPSSTKAFGNLVLASTTSAMLKVDASGVVGAYAGASACASGNAVTTISATGATTCAVFGNVSTDILANTIAGNFTYWKTSASSTLMATSSLSFVATSTVINTGPLSIQNLTVTSTAIIGSSTSIGTSTIAGQLLISNPASNTISMFITTSTQPDFLLVVAASGTPNSIIQGGVFSGTSTAFAIASSGIPYINGTSTAAIGGTSLTAGACSTVSTTTVAVILSSSTDVLTTTPQNFPGAGFTWYSYINRTGTTSTDITTEVCAELIATPVATKYNVVWVREIGL